MIRSRTVRLFAIVLFTLLPLSRATFAEPDTLFLGTGRDGSLTITSGSYAVNGARPLISPAASGATALVVDRHPNGPIIYAGDLVMVLQTQGLTPSPQSGNQQTLDLRASSIGTWEFARVTNVTTTVYPNDTYVLTAPLVHSYTANAQVVRVSEYTDVTLDGGSLVAVNFRGGSGGVLAILVQGTLTMKNGGALRADGAGFGSGFVVNDTGGAGGCAASDVLAPSGGGKGEGVGPAYDQNFAGRGNLANGAGGGNCYLAGGGGGGNAGAGGNGGASDPSDGDRLAGGYGGVALLASPLDHFFLGGGGGAGHSAHSTGGSGGRGGGLVFIRAGAIAGNGVISANGAPGGTGNLDAAGGGGAGGTIHIRSASTIDCGIALSATGGAGGAVATDGPGTGGGGGGGFVYFQAQSLACVNPALGGGIFGRNNVASSRYATAGIDGTVQKKGSAMQQPAPPSIWYPVAGAIVPLKHPPFSGYGTPGSSVRGYLDGVFIGDYFINDSGWSLSAPSIDLDDGQHTMRATTILEGLESAPVSRTFTVDTTPPAAPVITSPLAGATVNAHPVVAGTTEPSAHVRVTIDGTSWDATADSAGAFALLPITLANGSHTITAYATDVAGNDGPASTPFLFTVDAIAPATPTASLAGGAAVTNSVHPTFTGSSEAGSTISLKIGAITETFAGGASWTHTLTATLAEGSYSANVTALDGVGNESPAAQVAFVIDLTAPAAPQLTKPLANGRANRVEGTAELGATVFVTIDGVENGSTIADGSTGAWSFAPVSVGDGAHAVSARARDVAGNFGPSTTAISFTLDRIGPAAPSIISPVSGAQTTSRIVTVTGTTEGGASIELLATGNAVVRATTVAAQNGNWTATIAAPDDSTYVITAQATDVAGNRGAASSGVAVVVDARVTLTVTSPATAVYGEPVTITAAGKYLLNGQPMTEGTVRFFRDGVSFALAEVANGVATAIAQPLPGAHTLAATHSSLGTACCGSPTASLVINPAYTRVALRRSGSAFTASVTAVAPSVAIPDGNVVFRIDGATYTAPLVNGVATIQPTIAGGAAHQFAATYSGTAAFYASKVASVVAPLPAPAPAPAPPARRRAAGS